MGEQEKRKEKKLIMNILNLALMVHSLYFNIYLKMIWYSCEKIQISNFKIQYSNISSILSKVGCLFLNSYESLLRKRKRDFNAEIF